MAGFNEQLKDLEVVGAKVFAASVDTGDKSAEVANELAFPVAEGVTRADGDTLGAWWEENRNFIQPAEFLIGDAGKIMASSYSAGPLGRIDPEETLRLINFFESKK